MNKAPWPAGTLPFCLGGNVFGWTVTEAQSFDVLDAFFAAGGRVIDTADKYSAWAPGNRGGESERIIGKWIAARGNRAELSIGTKVGTLDGCLGLSAQVIRRGLEASLRRLGVDAVDVYYAHQDDPDTEQLETLRAFDELANEGKIGVLGASNFGAGRLREALRLSETHGLKRYEILQVHYNLVHRTEFEGELRGLCREASMTCFAYFGLAGGFLSGKYSQGAPIRGARSGDVEKYVDDAGFRVLDAVAHVAEAHGVTMSAIAVAWLIAQPGVTAPVVSATAPEQLRESLEGTRLVLSDSDLAVLRSGNGGARRLLADRTPSDHTE